MGGSSHTSHRHSDGYSRSNNQHRDHGRDYPHDSRDRYRSDSSQKRVPGLVSDPDRQLGDAESAIRRGQRETIIRVQSDRYSPSKSSRPTKDTMSSMLPAYNPTPMAVSRPYYPSSSRRSYSGKSRKFYNPGFLAWLSGLAGFALLIAAIVIVEWITSLVASTENLRVNKKGLFQVCSTVYTGDGITNGGCQSLEEFAQAGSVISDLEQATRGMVIIAAVAAFAAVIVSFVFGLNRFEKPKGSLISGGLYAFAGACGVTGMGCFSSVLVTTINSSLPGVAFTFPGTSFYLGWGGTALLLIASLTSFLGHCARWK